MQTKLNRYTEPRLSPAQPKSCDMSTDWYVWFRFFDEGSQSWKQLRFKKGINQVKVFKERLKDANALKQAIKEELAAGWNPLEKSEFGIIRIHGITPALDHILKIKSATLRTKSRYAYTYIIGIFKSWLKDNGMEKLDIDRITGAIAQQYMDWLLLKKGYSGRTFNDHLIVLRTFFNCFVEREWITKNPFRSVKRKTQTVGRNLAYTDRERMELSKYLQAHDRRLWLYTQLMFHCFIRRTELTTIRVKHVDLVNYTIVIPGETAKNNTQESVVIPVELVPVIREMNLEQYGPDDFVFGRGLETCSRQYKNPNWISTRHNEIVKQLNINPEKGLYSWKHTGVVAYYYATGKDIYSLMRQLRHRDLNTTMIYLKSLGLIQNDTFRKAMVA